MPTRYFVSVDDKGQPIRQRSSDREKPYVAACFEGHRFSSTGPNGAYPRKVVEVIKPLEWIARATLEDGSKVSNRSKSGPIGRNYVEYSYIQNAYRVQQHGEEPVRRPRVDWTDYANADEWIANQPGLRDSGLEVKVFVTGQPLELRGWDTSNVSPSLSADPMGDHHGRNE